MWQKRAVCVRCGTFKRRPMGRCGRCGFEPASDYEMARALILSLHFNVADTVIGRSSSDLRRIANDIRAGRPYLFDPNEEQVALYGYQHLQETARVKRMRNRLVWAGLALLGLGSIYYFYLQ